MRKHVLVLMTTAAILTCGAIAATAQAPGAQTPGTQQSPTTQPILAVRCSSKTKRGCNAMRRLANRKTAIRTTSPVITAE